MHFLAALLARTTRPQMVIIDAREYEFLLASHEQLQHDVHTDELTGLPNRRQFLARLTWTDRLSETYSLMMFDLNEFKAINDTFGRDAGNEALRTVADSLNDIRDTTDGQVFGARLHGDEFAAIIHGDAQTGLMIADSIISHIRTHGELSASAGIAYRAFSTTLEDLRRAADRAMHIAKRAELTLMPSLPPDIARHVRHHRPSNGRRTYRDM